jgi:hypothetical protein
MKTFSLFSRKIIVSVLLGPLTVIPAVFLLAYIEAIFSKQSVQVALGELFPLYVLVGLTTSYISTLVVGLPTVFVLNKLKKLTLVNVTLVWLVPLSVLCLFQAPSLIFWAFFSFSAFSVTCGCWGLYKVVV